MRLRFSNLIRFAFYSWIIPKEGKIKTERYALDYIIERKIADDLASSVIDGRLRDQRYRLIRTGLKNVMYLIEGRASLNSSRP